MGFFKKIFKGIGKVFKKIGKGIKKAFKGFGKFMGKIGVVGQIAMMFIPFGQIFAPMLQSLQSTFLGVLGKGLVSANPLIKVSILSAELLSLVIISSTDIPFHRVITILSLPIKATSQDKNGSPSASTLFLKQFNKDS